MVINDLFFIFFREKSDSFRTVTYQKPPKTVSKTPENRAFQACFQIASSRHKATREISPLSLFSNYANVS